MATPKQFMDWLWSSGTRQTSGRPWDADYVADAVAFANSLAQAQESPACICDERKAKAKNGSGLLWHCPKHGLMEFEK